MLLLYQIVHMVLIRTNYLKENIGFECDSLILIVSRLCSILILLGYIKNYPCGID